METPRTPRSIRLCEHYSDPPSAHMEGTATFKPCIMGIKDFKLELNFQTQIHISQNWLSLILWNSLSLLSIEFATSHFTALPYKCGMFCVRIIWSWDPLWFFPSSQRRPFSQKHHSNFHYLMLSKHISFICCNYPVQNQVLIWSHH